MRTEAASWSRWAALLGVSLSLAPLSCATGEAKAPNPTRPLDERRAIEVIRRALQREGAAPAPGRDVPFGDRKPIHIDVGVEGRAFGIVYVTVEDRETLGDAIPSPNKKDERLRLVRGGSDGETRLVLLYQSNYLFDDLAGASHEQTTITCEGQLTRDVVDFITHARTQKYK